MLGQHTAQILASVLGYSEQQITALSGQRHHLNRPKRGNKPRRIYGIWRLQAAIGRTAAALLRLPH
jgi:hypothetical protein